MSQQFGEHWLQSGKNTDQLPLQETDPPEPAPETTMEQSEPSAHLRATFVELVQSEHQSFTVQRFNTPGGSSLFNYHVGYQITLIKNGEGNRYIGDNVSRFEAPDLVIIGSELPHMWRTREPTGEIDSLVVNFTDRFLCGALLQTPEFAQIKGMLQNAKRGLLVGADTRALVEQEFWDLRLLQGFEQLMSLLLILNKLASGRDLKPIASLAFEAKIGKEEDPRLSDVFAYIQQHLHEPISRDQLAKVAFMSPSSFSRYFHERTGTNLPAFLNDFRIGFACKLLATSVLSISEIATQSGFGSVTSFNRVFQALKKTAPTEYRRRIEKARSHDGNVTM